MHIRTHRGLLPLALAIMGALLVSFAMTFADDNRASALTNCDVTHDGNDSEELAFLTLINDYRSQNGLGALTISTNLNRGSAWMTEDMATNNYFAHTDSLGRSAYQRAIDCGYPSGAGETLAAGGAWNSAQNAFNAWQNSPGHNATCSASTTSRSASPLLPGRLAIRLVLGNHLRDYGRWLGRWRRRHRTDQHPFRRRARRSHQHANPGPADRNADLHAPDEHANHEPGRRTDDRHADPLRAHEHACHAAFQYGHTVEQRIERDQHACTTDGHADGHADR